MPTTKGNYLGLVELADYEYLVDEYGSASAGYLRQEFFERLESWVRPIDQTRILKDQRFLVVLKNIDSSASLELATIKLTRLFNQPYELLGEAIPLHIHAGFALIEENDSDIKDALKKARTALRHSRKAETLYEIFDPDKQHRHDNERKLVKALEEAVELGEFQLYYQPKMHAGYGNIIGAEALIRWHTADQKILTPNHFIDTAERHPVIQPITWWAIKSAVAQLHKWPDHISIAVNVCPAVLLENTVIDVVADALNIYDIKPSRLTLEVTENIFIDNQDTVLKQLTILQNLGVHISIDDFGTGYASLSYFRDLPANELKIDKCFVGQMLESKKDQAIVKAVIDLAHNFSLRVVAEGVETQEIAEHLSQLGCDHLQGYVYDKPLPVEDFETRYL